MGAGPSGATAARLLAEAGLTVLLLERARLPRDKTCGGGLQAKVFKHLTIDVTPVVRSELHGICFTHGFAERFTRRNGRPLVYGTLRREFDTFLTEQAIHRGVKLVDDVRVETVEPQRDGSARVVTSTGAYSARVVIGADGANGVVRRLLNSETAFFNQAGLSLEIRRDQLASGSLEGDLMRVDWGTLPSGYAWVFPKGDYVNIGVGCPVAIARRLRPYLGRFLERERLLPTERVDLDTLPVRGHKLPSYTPRTRLVQDRILVVGDAAGLIDPFTGDGISYGIHSATLAADAVVRHLNGDARGLQLYADAVQAEIVPDIVHFRRLMTLFNSFPGMAHDVIRANDKVWDVFCWALHGDDAYDVFRRTTLERSQVLWKILDPFTAWYESRRLGRERAGESGFQRAVRATIGSILQRI